MGGRSVQDRTCEWLFRRFPPRLASRGRPWIMERCWNDTVSIPSSLPSNDSLIRIFFFSFLRCRPLTQSHRRSIIHRLHTHIRPPAQRRSASLGAITGIRASGSRCGRSIRNYHHCVTSGTCPDQSSVDSSVTWNPTYPPLRPDVSSCSDSSKGRHVDVARAWADPLA